MALTEKWVSCNTHPLLFLCVILNVVKDLLTLSLCIFRTEFSTNAFQILRDAQNDNLNAYPLLFLCVILNVVKDLLTLSLCIFRTEFSTNAFQILRDAQNDNLVVNFYFDKPSFFV